MKRMCENLKKLNEDGLLLKKIPKKEQTLEMCRTAINQNPQALKYVAKKYIDETLCLEAVKKDIDMFRYIPNQFKTKAMCLKAIKSDASLLEKIPYGWRTKKICLIAVTNEVKMLEYVPEEIIYEILNEDTSIELLDRIVQTDRQWLEYMPICQNGVDICLKYIKENIYNSRYIPEKIDITNDILSYQKSQGIMRIVRKFYNQEEGKFQIEAKIVYYSEILEVENNIVIERSYNIKKQFKSFDDFYKFLDGNLNQAELRKYDFKNINLKNYNIEGAIIHQNILIEQGLFDGSYFEEIKKGLKERDLIEEISIKKGFNYLKPVEEEGNSEFDGKQIPFFYVSDIHVEHRILHRFKERATKEEVRWYIKCLVKKMVKSIGTIPRNSYLLIAGDTASKFEIAKVFYKELSKLWKKQNIIVIHGNHELWDPFDELENNIKVYRKYFRELGIIFLHNELFLIINRHERLVFDEKKILELSKKELHKIGQVCSIAILGGIGFSGLNSKYNAITMRYGKSFDGLESPREILKKDIYEANKFNAIYKKILDGLSQNKVIILTHMQKSDWNRDEYNKNWIYVNGHTHRNYFDIDEKKIIYADNQIGYRTESLGLKYFYLDNEYDIFLYLEEGVHKITKNQYLDFNRGKLINMSFKRAEEEIYMIKKNEKYIFFLYSTNSKKSNIKQLYLLSGGRIVKLSKNKLEDIEYYFNLLDIYVKNINKLLNRYTGVQKKISRFIKRIGGSGKIHGCIVDIDRAGANGPYSYCHLFVNPTDGKVTPYFAYDIKSRIVYKDFRALLENQESCKLLKENYERYEKEINLNMLSIKYSDQLVDWANEDAIHDEGSYLYKISRIIKSLQYTTEKNIIRIWNEELINNELIERVETTNRIEEMIDSTVIL